MSYLPDGLPPPLPNPEEMPFWDGCKRRELLVQRCADCLTFRHPPVPICAHCRSVRTEWVAVPGTGEVFSYTIAIHPTHPALRGQPPYNIAVVLLDGAGDVRLVTNIMEIPNERLAIGLRVALRWDTTAEGLNLPRFVSVAEHADA